MFLQFAYILNAAFKLQRGPFYQIDKVMKSACLNCSL